jgi:hypothetical protein
MPRDTSSGTGAAAVKSIDAVVRIGLTFPDVEVATGWDGATVLRARGCFMAATAAHASAEPNSMVVRIDPDERQGLLEDAPETYYTTAYYRPHPVVLVRLSCIASDSMRDLLASAHRETMRKARPRKGHRSRHAATLNPTY